VKASHVAHVEEPTRRPNGAMLGHDALELNGKLPTREVDETGTVPGRARMEWCSLETHGRCSVDCLRGARGSRRRARGASRCIGITDSYGGNEGSPIPEPRSSVEKPTEDLSERAGVEEKPVVPVG
jgi:hypothetical protein